MGKIITEEFGKLPNGAVVNKYLLQNSKGLQVGIINYGAVITNLWTPDHKDKLDDIVLGFDSLSAYINDKSFIGAIVGRYANRIKKGQFQIAGINYELPINDGSNHLHGGLRGFSKQYWEAEPIETENAIQLSYLSKDGEEGYPGNLEVIVKYTLSERNELIVDYLANTDKDTIINLTQHSYFNLSGMPGHTALAHDLKINASKILVVDDDLIPTGEFRTIKDTVFDFNQPKRIGLDIDSTELKATSGFDHCYVLDSEDMNALTLAVEMSHQKSGRELQVYTDAPGMQLYSGNFLNNCLGKNQVGYPNQSAICLETQNFPDAPNHEHFPNPILKPGEEFKSRTIFKFT